MNKIIVFIFLSFLISIGNIETSIAQIERSTDHKQQLSLSTDSANSDAKNISAGTTTPRADANSTRAPQVTEVYNLRDEDRGEDDRNKAGLDDIIVVKVSNLKGLLDSAKCAGAAPNCEKKIRLFIEGREIKNIDPESGAPQPEDGELQFHLQRNEHNTEAWTDLLGNPDLDQHFFKKPLRISVGLENGVPITSKVDKFNIIRIRKGWFAVCLLLTLGYIVMLFVMAYKSEILRDRGIDASILGIVRAQGKRAPFSLGRFQMAFWFSVVLVSFLFIWLVTGGYDISASVIGLLGLGAGTALSGAVIDNSKNETLLQETLTLDNQAKVIRDEVGTLNAQLAVVPQPANYAELQTALQAKTLELTTAETTLKVNKSKLEPINSDGFLQDVLSDKNGISFHRYQMLIWTFVLGILFFYAVWHKLAMLDFPPTLLALQGLTSGIYLGFKIPEKQT